MVGEFESKFKTLFYVGSNRGLGTELEHLCKL